MQYRLLFCATKGVLCGWWFAGLAMGGTFALNYVAFIEVWRIVLLVLSAIVCVAAPFIGVWATRAMQSRLAKKRKVKLRGAAYADYAYIL